MSDEHLRDPARALVARTREEQGLPPAVEDETILRRVAALLSGGRD